VKQSRAIHVSDSLYSMLVKNVSTNLCSKVISIGIHRARDKGTRLLADKLIGDYFTFREKEGMISYTPTGRETKINADGTWSRDGRQSISPGKWARSMIHPRVARLLKIKDHDYAAIATAVKLAELSSRLTYKLVPVQLAYESARFDTSRIESCMWDCDVGEFYELFGAKAIVCVDGHEKWRGRAIVWDGVRIERNESAGPITFMDRIYADSPEITDGMKHYAASQGWWVKRCQSRGSTGYIDPDGERIDVTLKVRSVNGSVDGCDFYPYLDTFQYGHGDTLYSNGGGQIEYLYTCTGGEREEVDNHEGQVEDVHGNWIREDDAVSVGDDTYHVDDRAICYSEDSECYLLREDCVRIDGEWYRTDSDTIVYVESTGDYHLAEDCVYVERTNQYHLADDCASVDGVYQLLDDCVRVDGKWVLKSSDEALELATAGGNSNE